VSCYIYCYADCRYALCHYTEYRYAEGHSTTTLSLALKIVSWNLLGMYIVVKDWQDLEWLRMTDELGVLK